jgi:hypothetical protein
MFFLDMVSIQTSAWWLGIIDCTSLLVAEKKRYCGQTELESRCKKHAIHSPFELLGMLGFDRRLVQ